MVRLWMIHGLRKKVRAVALGLGFRVSGLRGFFISTCGKSGSLLRGPQNKDYSIWASDEGPNEYMKSKLGVYDGL